MYASQIVKALRSERSCVRSYFEGVFASDNLPARLELYPTAVVVNTDPEHKPGTHWIAYYFDKNAHLDYFDSYGFDPTTFDGLSKFAADNSNSVSYNDLQLQGFNTDVCGHYCIAFLVLRGE